MLLTYRFLIVLHILAHHVLMYFHLLLHVSATIMSAEDNGRVFLPTAIQKKPSSLHRQMKSNTNSHPNEVANVENQDTNGVVIHSEDVTDSKLPDAAPEAALLGNELEEVASDTDTNKMSEENELEDIQDPVDKEACSKAGGGKRKLQIQGKWRGVDPVVFFTNDAIVGSIKTFYGIDESFPFTGHLVTRNSDTDHVKRIYYVSKSVKDILELNFKGGLQLKITSVGLKMFVSSPCLSGFFTFFCLAEFFKGCFMHVCGIKHLMVGLRIISSEQFKLLCINC